MKWRPGHFINHQFLSRRCRALESQTGSAPLWSFRLCSGRASFSPVCHESSIRHSASTASDKHGFGEALQHRQATDLRLEQRDDGVAMQEELWCAKTRRVWFLACSTRRRGLLEQASTRDPIAGPNQDVLKLTSCVPKSVQSVRRPAPPGDDVARALKGWVELGVGTRQVSSVWAGHGRFDGVPSEAPALNFPDFVVERLAPASASLQSSPEAVQRDANGRGRRPRLQPHHAAARRERSGSVTAWCRTQTG
jgi:hypothetical protein